ncbi:hypothetical protein [Allocoleopsis sp.]|uniref:hypothetical protein n=1 Tax=Allocoleopsis sp. TaxID=3088169 RepID=UPI002FD2E493
MKSYRSVFWLNSASLLLVLALIIYAKFFGSSVSDLFLQPPFHRSIDVAFLTHTFQILCCVPPVVCAFTFALLSRIQPRRTENIFILYSALLTGGFLFNEIYRLHVILGIAGFPKLATISVYAIILLGYGLAFNRRIKSTPYWILLVGLGLLAFGILIDSLHLNIGAFSSLLEGFPKLFSEINIVFYFWYVCYGEIMRSLRAAYLGQSLP